MCLESRYPCDYTFFRLYLPWQCAHSSLQLAFQPWICVPGTHYGWVDQGSVEYEVCLTLLHRAGIGNRTPDLLIFESNALSTWPYAPKYFANLHHFSVSGTRVCINSSHWSISLDYHIYICLLPHPIHPVTMIERRYKLQGSLGPAEKLTSNS